MSNMDKTFVKNENKWIIRVHENIIDIEWGKKNGKMQLNKYVIDEGKQKRTPNEQAMFMAKSFMNRKMKDGYTDLQDTNSEIDKSPLPMLAKSFTNDLKNMCYLQPKLDGIRCMGNIENGDLWSRRQTKIEGLDHISNELRMIHNSLGVKWVDGELYNHSLTFNEINSYVRRTAEFTEKSRQIEYWVYDCVSDNVYTNRYEILQQIINSGFKYIRLVSTMQVKCIDDVHMKHKYYTELNYEGVMIRSVDKPYEKNKRTNQLMKLKDFQQEEYRVIGFRQKKTVNGNITLGSIELQDMKDHNIKFHATPAMTFEERRHIWETKDSYMDNIATVKFFEKTPKGVPRFPQLLGFRSIDDM